MTEPTTDHPHVPSLEFQPYPQEAPSACRTTRHCAEHGFCHRCQPEFAETMGRVNAAIQHTDPTDAHWGPLYAAVAEALRPATVSSAGVVQLPPTNQAAELTAAIYDALVDFQRTAQLASLQHAQMRQHLAEHLSGALALRMGIVPTPEAVRVAALLEGADAIDAETRQAKADGVLEPDTFRPCRDASAQLRRMACPTPLTHNWGCGCPSDVAAAIASCPGREIDGPSPCRCPCEGCKHNCAAHQPEAAVVVEPQPDNTQDGPRTVCVCGHTRGEHITISGRLLCDVCDPESTDNLVCKEFEAL